MSPGITAGGAGNQETEGKDANYPGDYDPEEVGKPGYIL